MGREQSAWRGGAWDDVLAEGRREGKGEERGKGIEMVSLLEPARIMKGSVWAAAKIIFCPIFLPSSNFLIIGLRAIRQGLWEHNLHDKMYR